MAEALKDNEVGIKHLSSDSGMDQYLTFLMEEDEYGVDILAVQEIHCWLEPRPIPNSPDYIKGVIDWRGTIVPIVDLRIRFGYSNATYEKTTVVIILQAHIEKIDQSVIVGVVVDAVSDVLDLEPGSVKDPPRLGSKVDTQYIKGVVKIESKMTILLELGKLIDLEQLEG